MSDDDFLSQGRNFSIKVPCSAKQYKIIYIAENIISADAVADPQDEKSGEIKLPDVDINISKAAYEAGHGNISSVPIEFK